MPMSPAARPRRFVAVLLVCALALLAWSATVGAASSPRSTHQPKARAASSVQVGVADEETQMFGNPLWQRLHTKVTRYIVPWDVVAHSYYLDKAIVWIHAAEAQHQQILVAFYHSEYTATRMPSVAQYAHFTQKFIKRFPNVHQYQPWNEANRGNVRYTGENFDSPTAAASAKYYQALRKVCPSCTILGLDILDQPEVGPSLEYLAEFKAELHHLRVPTPTIWGLHNYSDTNRFSSSRTRAILAAVPGQVWLTETGGIVKFGGAFPNNNGSGLSRAARALSYMFALASSNSRIKRLYVYQWTGASHTAIFDAGLTDYRHQPRPGYVVVCKHMHAAKCSKVRVSSH
jgi:hypothetical protein